MSEQSQAGTPSQPEPTGKPDAAAKGTRWVALVIVLTLVWYLLADRFTP